MNEERPVGGDLSARGRPPEAALASLGATSTPSERWAALIGFVERWYGKPVGHLAVEAQARVGPPLLRKLLGVQAVAPEIVQHNELVRADELKLEDGKVVFLVENQGVCLWATELEGADPRVWYRSNHTGGPWLEEPERLSGFLAQALLFEAIMHAPFGASGTALPPETVRAILSRVGPLGTPGWNWCRGRFFARDGALVMTMERDDECSVWLAARTPQALSPFEGLVGERWDYVAF